MVAEARFLLGQICTRRFGSMAAATMEDMKTLHENITAELSRQKENPDRR